MRLVFIHGRAQGEKNSRELEAEWTAALEEGYRNAGENAPPRVELSVPFYGRTLDDLTEGAADGIASVIERGSGVGAPGGAFEGEFLLELARGAGITDEDINVEMGAGFVERGPENWEWVHAVGRLLSRRAPWLSEKVMATITADVNAYLTLPNVRNAVNDIVRPTIDGDRSVVVAHSLGTIVAYWILHNLEDDAEVPLLVTLGSPLGIQVVKQRLPRPLGIPQGVDHWFNAADERDPVALYSVLDERVFAADIENLNDVKNPGDNPHGISGYLSEPRVARKIAAALRS